LNACSTVRTTFASPRKPSVPKYFPIMLFLFVFHNYLCRGETVYNLPPNIFTLYYYYKKVTSISSLLRITAIKFTNVFLQNIRKQSLYQDVFCRDGGRLRA